MSTKQSFNDSTGSMLTQDGMGSLLGRVITTLSRTRFILLRSPYSSLSQSPRLASAVTWAIWLDHRLIELVLWFNFKTTQVWKMISEIDFCETFPNEISMAIEPFGLIFTRRCSCHWSHLSHKKDCWATIDDSDWFRWSVLQNDSFGKNPSSNNHASRTIQQLKYLRQDKGWPLRYLRQEKGWPGIEHMPINFEPPAPPWTSMQMEKPVQAFRKVSH